MCFQFRLETTYKDVAEYMELNPEQPLEGWRGTLFPEYPLLAILPEHKPAVLRWGFKHPGMEKKYVANAQSETAATSPMFRGQFKKSRCLIPATGFIEWNPEKFKFYITLPEPVFAFAGLYNSAGECTMLTTQPNPFMEKIHNRMPVILHKRDYDQWLNEPVKELLVPYVGEMKAACIQEPKAKEPKAKEPKAKKTRPLPEHQQGELF